MHIGQNPGEFCSATLHWSGYACTQMRVLHILPMMTTRIAYDCSKKWEVCEALGSGQLGWWVVSWLSDPFQGLTGASPTSMLATNPTDLSRLIWLDLQSMSTFLKLIKMQSNIVHGLWKSLWVYVNFFTVSCTKSSLATRRANCWSNWLLRRI